MDMYIGIDIDTMASSSDFFCLTKCLGAGMGKVNLSHELWLCIALIVFIGH